MASSSLPSDSLSSEMYDVFVSFRGEDTRGNFTSHLYAALERNSIKAFIDNNIQKGDEVWPTLAKAIENSRASIVVFSKDYASSKWCLEELVKILERREHHEQIVIPVFFQIDPSHVRKQTGSYEEAIAKHVRDLGDTDDESNQNKVSRWKAALAEAANIAGYSCTPRDNQSKLVEEISNDILQKLYKGCPFELKGLVGIYENQDCIESLLKEVPVVGIWGMGGIGKTTLAKVVFAKLSSQYVSRCFLENVREEVVKCGLNYLKNRLRSQLLGQESMESSDDVTWLRMLGYKKVLIVFDDVSRKVIEFVDEVLDQLNFGQTGSRVIITARDTDLLTVRVNDLPGINGIHEVKGLNHQDSTKLFCLNAFKESSPKMGYEELSKRAVDYANGVPLAIKVLGSLLGSRSNTESWNCELKKLQDHPNVQIQDVLRLSYNDLEGLHKDLFLDIAFFFRGENKDVTTEILNACGFYATSGIDTLLCKALITISYDNQIQMHDLIQAMGLEIVRESSIKDLGRRTRLRDTKEVYDMLKNNKGTDAVEGIMLNMSKITKDLHLSADTFTKMPNLRFLKFYSDWWTNRSCNVCLLAGLESFPDNLSYLQWDEYPLGSLPSSFSFEKLVELHMPDSQVTKLWDGKQDLVNLREINLSGCRQLMELWDGEQDLVNLRKINLSGCTQLMVLPDFSEASKLEWVDLSDCESLCQVHHSILSLHSLETLNLRGCIKLSSLTSDTHLRSLKELNLEGCHSLMEFSVSSEELKELELLDIRIEKLNSSSIGRLKKLERLTLSCLKLENLPIEGLSCLSSLNTLFLHDIKQGLDKSNLTILFNGLRSLEILSLRRCQNFFELPTNIEFLSRLVTLDLSRNNIESLPESVKHLSRLRGLFLRHCQRLCSLPELPSSIQVLNLNKSNIESLPESVKHLPTLRRLFIRHCQRLCSLPELPPSIQFLDATNCTSLKTVFTLKTSIPLKGNGKWILFPNCKNLDEGSVKGIIEDGCLLLSQAAYENKLLHCSDVSFVSNDKKFVNICLPGDRVPEWFGYRTREASIVVELPPPSDLLGFVLCVVLSQNNALQDWEDDSIQWQCYSEEGNKIRERTSYRIPNWYNEEDLKMTSHHVCLWYDPHFNNRILAELGKSTTNYQCNATSCPRVKMSFHLDDDLSVYNALEWGMCPIYASKNLTQIWERVSESEYEYESEYESEFEYISDTVPEEDLDWETYSETDSETDSESKSGFRDKTKRPREIDELEARENGDGVGSSSEKESLPQSKKLKEF